MHESGTMIQYSCVDGVTYVNGYAGTSCTGDYESVAVDDSSISCSSSGLSVHFDFHPLDDTLIHGYCAHSDSCDYSMFKKYIEGNDSSSCVDPNSGTICYVCSVSLILNEWFTFHFDAAV